jgi:hypothetical protein
LAFPTRQPSRVRACRTLVATELTGPFDRLRADEIVLVGVFEDITDSLVGIRSVLFRSSS